MRLLFRCWRTMLASAHCLLLVPMVPCHTNVVRREMRAHTAVCFKC